VSLGCVVIDDASELGSGRALQDGRPSQNQAETAIRMYSAALATSCR